MSTTERPPDGVVDRDGDLVVDVMHAGGRYESIAPATSRGRTMRAYLLLTKPRIIELLLVTTVPSMVIAAGGWPGTRLVLLTLLGGALCAGSANAINNWFDRDIDAAMRRTSRRPTADDSISPTNALRFGVVIGALGFALLWFAVNPAAALLATSAILFYVFVYTMWLKRRTSQAVVIGGAAGCMPVLTGWAAVQGWDGLSDPRPWLLFALIFWWTPPHFWALALKYREDYAAAGLPMLPVTFGAAEATRHIVLYSYLLVGLVALYAVASGGGLVFVLPGAVLTAGFVGLAHSLRRDPTTERAMRLFHYSNSYLALLFLAAAVDAVR